MLLELANNNKLRIIPIGSDGAAYARIIIDGENVGIGGSVVNDSHTTS